MAQETACTPFDNNGDNVVGITDLIDLLARFGDSDLDMDGIWDSVDACVGAYDNCGVCNGPGPQVLAIDTIIINYDSIYVEAIDEWLTYELNVDTLLHLVCENPGCTDPVADNFDPYAEEGGTCFYPDCYTPTFDGYTYDVVHIGDQCWFAENLRTTVYSNGYAIPASLTDSEWGSTTLGATAVFGEGSSYCDNDYNPYNDACDDAQSLAQYGRLYNWYAVDDARGLCPSGWHVPTDGEWTQLEDYVKSQGFGAFQQTVFTPFCDNPSADSCEYIFNMQDSWGDGWNGWTYDFLQNENVIATVTLAEGYSGIAGIILANGVPCTIVVNTIGSSVSASEVSWTISDEEGNVIVSIPSQLSFEGTALKSTYGWHNGGNGTDNFGFSALPSGYRNRDDGNFEWAGEGGVWWSSSPSGGSAWNRYLFFNSLNILRGTNNSGFGFSVRCLRDAD